MIFEVPTFEDASQTLGDLVRLPDGNFLAVAPGGRWPDLYSGVVRLKPDGALDPTFGENGLAVVGFRGGDLTVDAAGRILLVGDDRVARLTPEGHPDTGWSEDGVAVVPEEPDLSSLAVAPNGRVVVGGDDFTSGQTYEGQITAFTDEGELDAGFGTGGDAEEPAGGHLSVTDLQIQPDGRILVAGAVISDEPPIKGLEPRYDLLRYEADGEIDETFGEGQPGSPGRVTDTCSQTIAIQPAGTFLTTAAYNVYGPVACAWKWGPDGQLLSRGGGFSGERVFEISPDETLLTGGSYARNYRLDTAYFHSFGVVGRFRFDDQRTVFGRAFLPELLCRGENPTHVVSAYHDYPLWGTDRADVIMGNGEDDRIIGKGGNDLVCSGGGVDMVDLGAGRDWIAAGPALDQVKGGIGNDTLFGQTGYDRLFGNRGDDRLFGGLGNDRLRGGWGDDLLRGGRGSDRPEADEAP